MWAAKVRPGVPCNLLNRATPEYTAASPPFENPMIAIRAGSMRDAARAIRERGGNVHHGQFVKLEVVLDGIDNARPVNDLRMKTAMPILLNWFAQISMLGEGPESHVQAGQPEVCHCR